MTLTAALLTPNLSMGGAERWIVSLVKHSDPTRIRWSGVALSGWGGCDPELCGELAKYTRVVSGPPRAEVIAHAPAGKPPPAVFDVLPHELTEVANLPTALQTVTAEADVLVTWGGHRFDRYGYRAIPTVLVSHSSHSKPQPLGKRQGVSHLVAVSEAAVRPFVFDGNGPVTVIHNGADETRLQAVRGRRRQRVAWGYRGDERIVGYVGRFSQEKNPCAAIQAIRELGDPWRAVYYGELPARQTPPEPDLIAAAVRERSEKVRVCRYTANVADVYAGLDVLMLASHTEAFSMTMIEAWLTGVPIVSTPVGAVPELEARFGPLTVGVPLNPSPADLARACDYAMSPAGQALAARAQAIARANWTVEIMADRWADYLELVVAGKSIPPGLFLGKPRSRWLDLDL